MKLDNSLMSYIFNSEPHILGQETHLKVRVYYIPKHFSLRQAPVPNKTRLSCKHVTPLQNEHTVSTEVKSNSLVCHRAHACGLPFHSSLNTGTPRQTAELFHIAVPITAVVVIKSCFFVFVFEGIRSRR